jgi:hypothetical protein
MNYPQMLNKQCYLIECSQPTFSLAPPGTDTDRHQQLGILTEIAESLGEI